MVKRAVNLSKEKSYGYLIDNIFVTDETYSYYAKELPDLISEHEDGALTKGNFTSTNGGLYRSIDTVLVSSNPDFVRWVFDRNGIKMRPFLFKKLTSITQRDAEKRFKGLSSFWYALTALRSMNVYEIYYMDGSSVGFVAFNGSSYFTENMTLQVGMLEVKEKRRGWGTKIVNQMLELNDLSGLPTSEAYPFWETLGASYKDDDIHFNIKRRVK